MKSIMTGNGVRTFFLKLGIFCATVAVADFAIGKVLKTTYFRQRHGYDYLTTQTIAKINEPVLVFGSSRAVNIIHPLVLEEKLNMPCYNAGRVGQSVFYHYAMLKAVLQRHRPKQIILSFDAGDFAKGKEDYDRIASLLPYVETHPELEPIVALKGPFEKLKTLSSIYPYNSMMLPIVNGTLEKNKHKYQTIKGHVPLKQTISGPRLTVDYSRTAILDTNKINIYKAFIRECKAANISLHIICPPYLVNPVGADASIAVAKKTAAEMNVPFIDFSNDDFYTSQPELFADFRHLNDEGATIFTEQLASHLTASANQ